MESIIKLKDAKIIPDIVHEYTPKLRNESIPIVIDNGSFQCRAGWACNKEPSLVFRNLIAKPRKDRNKKDETVVQPKIQIGNELVNIEAMRFQLRTQFDRNVVTHYHIQEQIFDYIFKHLGIDHVGGVPHPIVLTECFSNPNTCRAFMSELLFETYNVPSIAYAVDGLLSYNFNNHSKDGLIVNIGYNTTHIIPILNGKVIGEKSRRINIGGSHMVTYMHRLLQLKYPVHVNAITLSRAEELLHEHCSVAIDYIAELKLWATMEFYEKNVKIVQLPFTGAPPPPVVSEEQKQEKKRELVKRLVEINARKREEKLLKDEETLQKLVEVRAMYFYEDQREYQKALKTTEVKSFDELEKLITTTAARIEKTKQKMSESGSVQDKRTEERAVAVPQPPPHLSMDDWLNDIKLKRESILEKKQARRQKRQDLAKRRTAAAQERMRIISHLARKEKGTDDFGSRDEDWDIYKAISKEGGESDSEAENEKIMEYNEILRHHDPNYLTPLVEEGNTAELHQLHVGVESIRVPEILFQPSMIGCSEAGLVELLDFVFKMFTNDQQLLLANNIFLTGSVSKLPGLKGRLERELLEIRPFQTSFKVKFAKDPTLDAWHGACKFASNSTQLKRVLITRSDYEEKGAQYLKEFHSSNVFTPTPAAVSDATVTVMEQP